MAKRRSLDDALTPEEQAFLEKGSPAPTQAKASSKPKPKEESTIKKEEPAMARPAMKEDFTHRRDVPVQPAQITQGFSVPGVV